MAAPIDPIVGRYVHVSLDGRAHRIYFEESGRGIPLLCLHTAGADGRQFRHLMTDSAVTDHYRVLAFDLPWHGKSTPPDGWEREEYRLTTRPIRTRSAVSALRSSSRSRWCWAARSAGGSCSTLRSRTPASFARSSVSKPRISRRRGTTSTGSIAPT